MEHDLTYDYDVPADGRTCLPSTPSIGRASDLVRDLNNARGDKAAMMRLVMQDDFDDKVAAAAESMRTLNRMLRHLR